MSGAKLTKRTSFNDGDWILLHREPGGYGSPRVVDGGKQFGITVKDFLSDIPTNPVTDTDCPNSGVENTLLRPVMYDAGLPPTLDVDRVVTITDMIVGDYTIAEASPVTGEAMNVTVTHTITGGLDTLGTIDIVGTDIDDQVLTESITPANGVTVQGTMAFKTVDHVTGVGWSVDAGTDYDHITVGFGDLIGLPDLCVNNTVLFAVFNAVREATAPTVTFSATVLALNTVDLDSATNGSAVQIYYLV